MGFYGILRDSKDSMRFYEILKKGARVYEDSGELPTPRSTHPIYPYAVLYSAILDIIDS